MRDLSNFHFFGISAEGWVQLLSSWIIEGLIIGLVFLWLQNRSQKKSDKAMERHEREIEALINKRANELRIFIQSERKLNEKYGKKNSD